MKILIIHTYYQQRGGEDTVFEQECALLKKENTVETLIFYNRGGLVGALQFLISIWNVTAAKKVRQRVRLFEPEIVHIHNWHFACGPIIVVALKKLGIPVVVTLHNFRLLCPSSTLLHHGLLFTDSLYADFPWRAVKQRVFRDSYLQTFWLAFIVWFHKKRGTWHGVNTYIVLTDFAKNLFTTTALRLPADKIFVKPNFVTPLVEVSKQRENFYLFIGRLSEEKGIALLLDTFKNSPFQLVIGGSGPLKEDVLAASKEFPNISYLGNLNKTEVNAQMRRCTALLFPSMWFEGMPLTILEAFASSTPVICSNLGAMESMIQNGINGLHFEAGNAKDLGEKLYQWHQTDASVQAEFGNQALLSYEKLYTIEKNKEVIMQIYSETLAENTGAKSERFKVKAA